MTVEAAPASPITAKRVTWLFACVLLLAVALIWAWLSMRSVMGVGGACASGGAYEIATPCPDGSWLIAIAMPMLIITALVGSMFAATMSAPNLLLPMWMLLFGSLGWNFLEFGLFRGDVEVGWIVCGVMFELMALPVLFLIPVGRKHTPKRSDGTPRLWWWIGCYLGLASVGVSLGAWSYVAIAT
jgi:hypothetical protein